MWFSKSGIKIKQTAIEGAVVQEAFKKLPFSVLRI
jgi:hypothetical protein